MINPRPYINGDSTVAVATRLRDWCLSNSGSVLGMGNGFFLFSKASRPVLVPTQSPLQRPPEALSPMVKRPGREAEHPPPSGGKVKTWRSCTSSPPYAVMACAGTT